MNPKLITPQDAVGKTIKKAILESFSVKLLFEDDTALLLEAEIEFEWCCGRPRSSGALLKIGDKLSDRDLLVLDLIDQEEFGKRNKERFELLMKKQEEYDRQTWEKLNKRFGGAK